MKRQGSHLRNYLFYGLTLILVSVFIYLVVQGRRMEKLEGARSKETVQDFKAGPIRALNPGDLEITPGSVPLRRKDGTEPGLSASRVIKIHNAGEVSYGSVQLKLDYCDTGKTILYSVTRNVEKLLPPGDTQFSIDIPLDNIPLEAVECRLSIVYADMEIHKPENRRTLADN